MRVVFYQGDFDKEQQAKRIVKGTVLRILQSNINYLPRLGHDSVEDAMAAIEADAVLKMADGAELWMEEA